MHDDEDIDPQFAAAVKASKWQKARRRADFAGDTFSIGGFGPEGIRTLWRPRAEIPTRIRRINGHFKRVLLPSAMTTPAMVHLRRMANKSIRIVNGRVLCGVDF